MSTTGRFSIAYIMASESGERPPTIRQVVDPTGV